MLWVAVAPLLAQELPGPDVPPPPEGRILDQARLFEREPDRLEALSLKFRDFSERTGYPVYLAIHDSLIGSDTSERARLLADAWLGSASGVVVVFESDSGSYACEWRGPAERGLADADGTPVPTLGESDLPPQEELFVVRRLAALGELEKSSADAVERLALTLVGTLDHAFRRSTDPYGRERTMRLVGLIVALLAFAGLLALAGLWALRRFERRGDERLVFPRVRVATRLGAPFGGGRISSRSFRVDARSDDS